MFVGNISFDATEDELRNTFEENGVTPTGVRILTQVGGRSKGYVHVLCIYYKCAYSLDSFRSASKVTGKMLFFSTTNFTMSDNSTFRPTLPLTKILRLIRRILFHRQITKRSFDTFAVSYPLPTLAAL